MLSPALRRDFDVVGIAILAVITALGGGTLRDLVLGDTPPPAFTRWGYLVGRDVIPREPPALVRPHSELYAVPAVAGAVAVAIA